MHALSTMCPVLGSALPALCRLPHARHVLSPFASRGWQEQLCCSRDTQEHRPLQAPACLSAPSTLLRPWIHRSRFPALFHSFLLSFFAFLPVSEDATRSLAMFFPLSTQSDAFLSLFSLHACLLLLCFGSRLLLSLARLPRLLRQQRTHAASVTVLAIVVTCDDRLICVCCLFLPQRDCSHASCLPRSESVYGVDLFSGRTLNLASLGSNVDTLDVICRRDRRVSSTKPLLLPSRDRPLEGGDAFFLSVLTLSMQGKESTVFPTTDLSFATSSKEWG